MWKASSLTSRFILTSVSCCSFSLQLLKHEHFHHYPSAPFVLWQVSHPTCERSEVRGRRCREEDKSLVAKSRSEVQCQRHTEPISSCREKSRRRAVTPSLPASVSVLNFLSSIHKHVRMMFYSPEIKSSYQRCSLCYCPLSLNGTTTRVTSEFSVRSA